MDNLNGFKYENQERLQRQQREAALIAGQRAILGKSKFEKEAERTSLGCIGSIAALVALCCLITFWVQLAAQIQLQQQGISTPGTVNVIARNSRGVDTLSVVFSVNEKKYTHISDQFITHLNPGDSVSVRYLPTNPDQSEIVGVSNPTMFFLFLIFITGISGYYVWNTYQKYCRLAEPEMPLGNFQEPVSEGPDWATKPYQQVKQTIPLALEEIDLNPLPGNPSISTANSEDHETNS